MDAGVSGGSSVPAQPLVSAIIPTLNSSKTLKRTLESLAAQSYDGIEIVVADGGSSDYTIAMALDRGAIVVAGGSERSSSKNAGAEASRGSLLYFVDDDFVLDSDVVRQAVAAISEGFDAVIIPNRSDPSLGFWARVRHLERECYVDDEVNVAARFVRREVFHAVGGFDVRLYSAEDYDFHYRLLVHGVRLGRTTAAEWHVGEPQTISEVAKKAFYYGANATAFLKKNPDIGLRLFSPLRGALLRHWRRLIEHPVLLAGFVVETTVKYASASLGALFAGRAARKRLYLDRHTERKTEAER